MTLIQESPRERATRELCEGLDALAKTSRSFGISIAEMADNFDEKTAGAREFSRWYLSPTGPQSGAQGRP